MQSVSKSFLWIFVFTFTASLLSIEGFASSSVLQKNTITELVGRNNSEGSSVTAVDFNQCIPVQKRYSSIFSTFDFNHFLNIFNTTCYVKLKTQNLSVDNYVNCSSIRKLVFIYHVNTDYSDNIFIG